MLQTLQLYFISLGLSSSLAPLLTLLTVLMSIGGVSWLLMRITRQYLSAQFLKVLKKSGFLWVKHLSKHKILNKLSFLVPGLLFYMIHSQLAEFGSFGVFLSKGIGIVSALYLVLMFTLIINSFLNIIVDTYESYEISKRNPIRSYIQVVKIIAFAFSSIISLSIILDKSPLVFFTGLGAAMTIILLVFKDTILGFVASIQLAFYDIVRIGDWITVPNYNTDGDVEEISLTTVKIRNFDKTVSTIPTYALLTSGIKNWRGMQESGGRRIKRSINIDMNTIKFCSKDMLERFSGIDLLVEPLKNRQEEIIAYNRELVNHQDIPVNGRMMTNLGIFRLYMNEYLRHNKHIHKNDFTFMVRQLQPTETGLPMEIYTFTNDTVWANYETIQADIFDHLLAVMSIFELKVFQNITGNELPNLISSKKTPSYKNNNALKKAS